MIGTRENKHKLPLLIGLPVVLVIGLGAAYVLTRAGADDPAPPPPPGNEFAVTDGDPPSPDDPGDPLYVDPGSIVRPTPRPGAPTSAAAAAEIEAEARATQETIRARLELRFKNNGYELNRDWTLESVVRRLDLLDGKYFSAADFRLSFDDGDQPFARIECGTRSGAALPDGPLVMLVNLKTGETVLEGRLHARDAAGYLLLGEKEWLELTQVMRNAVANHYRGRSQSEEVELFNDWYIQQFETSDFKATDRSGVVEFSCETLRGQPVSERPSVTLDYNRSAVTVSRSSSPHWMPVPNDREVFMENLSWALELMVRRPESDADTSREAVIERCRLMASYVLYGNVTPFDLRIDLAEDGVTVVISVASSFGRPLPFAEVKYRGNLLRGTGAFD